MAVHVSAKAGNVSVIGCKEKMKRSFGPLFALGATRQVPPMELDPDYLNEEKKYGYLRDRRKYGYPMKKKKRVKGQIEKSNEEAAEEEETVMWSPAKEEEETLMHADDEDERIIAADPFLKDLRARARAHEEHIRQILLWKKLNSRRKGRRHPLEHYFSETGIHKRKKKSKKQKKMFLE